MKKTAYPVPCYAKKEYIKSPVTVLVPGSKSMTNRALLLAALADGESRLNGALFSEDSRSFLNCLHSLGFNLSINEQQKTIHIKGEKGNIPNKSATINVQSAGTTARFLSALLGMNKGNYFLDASDQMCKRPMKSLLDCLEDLGCEITYTGKKEHLPYVLNGHGFCKQSVCIDINESSQFLSALLICSILSKDSFTIQTTGNHGMSYIHMTIKMMKQFGVEVQCPNPSTFFIPSGQHYACQNYNIEPDVSGAAYFYGASALLGVPVLVKDVHFNSLQGDIAFLHILEKMGCKTEDLKDGILLTPPENGQLHGICVQMSTCSDQAITLAALAPFADSKTTITGIRHIRYQECNRIQAITTELKKMGISCIEEDDNITIFPGIPKASLVNTYNDHRMAMGFSLIGLKVPGIVIDNPSCCSKTFENYFETLDEFLKLISTNKNPTLK